jgi:uncharacterized protein (DUF362 family)
MSMSPPEHVVALAASPLAGYGPLTGFLAAPELPGGCVRTVAEAAVRELFRAWGLDLWRFGTPDWNPLAEFVSAGARVVVKPNWVLHYNKSGEGLDCLVTHPSLIEAMLQYLHLARPGRVTVGDAPVQSCNFAKLRAACGLDRMVEGFRSRGMNIELADFRNTILAGETLGSPREANVRPAASYVLFDLKDDSLLEPVTTAANTFRVSMYNPDELARTHQPRRHEYLVAREVIEADVVFNLPKLKCHKKAGITGALKNVVGICGNKEYLPHHRKGSPADCGDAYEQPLWLKAVAETLLDSANRASTRAWRNALERTAEFLLRLVRRATGDDEIEGCWPGNDTVWRTCLDLQRILHYGRPDGGMAAKRQRTVVTITDAIIAGERQGPLSPTPVASGFVTGAVNVAAAEWVHALLMGFDPVLIPLVKESFGQFPYPLAGFNPAAIRLRSLAGDMLLDIRPAHVFVAAQGWLGKCELRGYDHDHRNVTKSSMAPIPRP